MSGVDYVGVSANLIFGVGDSRVCHDVPITDDGDCEIDPIEDFFANLAYVSGEQPINIDPDRTRVIIDDTAEPECAPIDVGYEFTVYTTTEGIGVVTICAIIMNSAEGSPRPFAISSTTEGGVAGKSGIEQ